MADPIGRIMRLRAMFARLKAGGAPGRDVKRARSRWKRAKKRHNIHLDRLSKNVTSRWGTLSSGMRKKLRKQGYSGERGY